MAPRNGQEWLGIKEGEERGHDEETSKTQNLSPLSYLTLQYHNYKGNGRTRNRNKVVNEKGRNLLTILIYAVIQILIFPKKKTKK